jgi:hypothetical protein
VIGRVAEIFYGDDIFVSYARSDAFKYAARLATALADAGFTCGFDQWRSEPSADNPKSRPQPVSLSRERCARNPELLHTLNVGKAEADDRVERSLYMRANGYSYDAVKIFMPAGAKVPIYAPYVDHMPPDVTACIF